MDSELRNSEERLIELEIKIARQEDLMDALNKTIFQQQKKIDELEALCTALARRVRDLREVTGEPVADEPPPHY
ncbi:SlyX family protein [Oxalobacteraceae bacterium OM1]|nr:SlyX family protein [Oxalobacteraceae bacterium OM1]